MKVILRVSKSISSHPSPYFRDDKRSLVSMCFRSLINAGFTDITILGDNIEDWKDDFNDVEFVDASVSGNFETFYQQLEIAKDYEKVLICEDDYLWRPDIAYTLDKSLDKLSLVFPYDHPGHYLEDRFGDEFRLTLIGNTTYRYCPSNTLTFATTGEVIKKYWNILTGYGTQDHEMFTKLSENIELWCPIYSFATHLVEGLMAPNVDWREFANM